MKLLDNSYTQEAVVVTLNPSPRKQEWLTAHEADEYYCRYCGCSDSAIASYSENVYGTATVVNVSGDLDGYESEDSGDFDVHNYRCRECDAEERRISNLVTDDLDEGWEAYKRANDIEEEEDE